MPLRYSQADVLRNLTRFAAKLGTRVARDSADVGGLTLDYDATGGGYAIGRIERTGISYPFTSYRRRAGAFVAFLLAGEQAVDYAARVRARKVELAKWDDVGIWPNPAITAGWEAIAV